MPRTSRIDYPGALHHVITRGIEKKYIFEHADDKRFFLSRLTDLLSLYSFRCYAWSVMDNHIHILLQTNDAKLSIFMHRLLTSYAYYYNRKYKRVGHLFQNRYKSIVCDKDENLLTLIRYIHLNPVKAGICDFARLKRFPWSGHKELAAGKVGVITHAEEVLSLFGVNKKSAIQQYNQFMQQGLNDNVDFEGGGLKRSLGDSLYALNCRNAESNEVDQLYDQ